jgi:hypothetical protein
MYWPLPTYSLIKHFSNILEILFTKFKYDKIQENIEIYFVSIIVNNCNITYFHKIIGQEEWKQKKSVKKGEIHEKEEYTYF